MATVLRDLMVQEFEKNRRRTLETVSAFTPDQLSWLPGQRPGNSAGFLFWHMARREDYHLQNRIQGIPQIWQTEGWHQRIGLDPEETGFGFTPEQVRAFQVPIRDQATGYYNRIREETLGYLRRVDDDTLLGSMPDPSDISIASYLMMRLGHEHEHWGQIDYLKGIMPA